MKRIEEDTKGREKEKREMYEVEEEKRTKVKGMQEGTKTRK